MREDTLEKLRQISQPRTFAKDEYICYEGQPGNEMYIILVGSIGVFLTSAIGTLTQVATMNEGDFFGEMAIFDNLPRSASCIALKNTVAVAITQENLEEFLEACPDIAKSMLESMSGRIRKMNDDLYKNSRFVKNRKIPKFAIPREYGQRHIIKEPYTDPKYITEYRQPCPICGKTVIVKDLKRNILETRKMDLDCRMSYVMCEPMWHEIISCPHCYYTNHYLKFFSINNFEYEEVKTVLREEYTPIIMKNRELRGAFDNLVLHYLQAIHVNEKINPQANALIGGMWRNLYWLAKDSDDMGFASYCAKMAVEKFKKAFEENQIFDEISKTSTALSLASLLSFCGETKSIMQYIDIATESPDVRIRECALRVKERIMQMLEKK